MQLQEISKHSNRSLHLKQSLLEATQLKSSRSSVDYSTPKLKLKQPQVLTPPKMAKYRSKKPEVSNRLSEVDGSEFSKSDEPQVFQISVAENSDFIYNKYDIWDLTYSLINAKIDKKILIMLFIVQVFVRYFSILSLIYITIRTYSEQWQWVFILVFTNTLYFICIVKISLKPAETQSQFILKQSFNSLEQNEASDYFQVISPKKFLTSVARGLVPPQFSCLYIKDSERRAEIYAMINYIYSSIEAVIYYPFFIIYMMIIIKKDKELESKILFNTSVGFIALSEIIFIIASIYLLIFGCKKKGYFKSSKEK